MNRLILSLGTLLWVALIPAGCGPRPGHAGANALPPASVQTQIAEYKKRIASEEDIGTVRAQLRAVIEAKVSGKIEAMLVVPGQPVTNDELLATLDAREIQARYDQAAAVRQQAESDLRRATDLLQQKTLSQSEFDAVQARFGVADAAAAEAGTLRSYTKISAPFSGVITRKDADVGDLAVPGKPLLEMEDPRHLRLEADVPEALVGNVKLGDMLPVRIGALETNLVGTVGEIAPSADPNSRTFLVKLDLPPVPGLRAGQFGRVAVPTGEISALRVPASAVIQRGDMQLLFVVADHHALLRIIKTGAALGDEVEVVSGLDAGEPVVVSGADQLLDGQPVVVKP